MPVVPGVKNQTMKQTYDDPTCYAGTALTELVFFSSLEKAKWFSVQVIGATYNECNKAKVEELIDISQQVHSTNCEHIKEQCLDLKPYKDGREVLLDLSKDAEIV